MHDTCPSLADLTATDQPSRSLRVHVAECASCRALARLAAATGDPIAPRTAECAAHELLVAVVAGGGVLDADQAALFDGHAGRCDRCAAGAAVLLLDREGIAELASGAPAAGEIAVVRGDWRPAVDPELGRALRRKRRTLLIAGAAIVAAAAAGVALGLRPSADEDPQAGAVLEPAPAPSPPPVPSAPPPAPRRSIPQGVEDLLAEAKTAAMDGRYERALEACERALAIEPDNQEAIKTCAIASCKLKAGWKATRYIRRITSETRREMMRQLCLHAGLEIDP